MRHCRNLVAAALFLSASSAIAAPVTDWHTFRAAPATTLAGQGTANPVMGTADGTTTVSSSNGFLVGYFNPISLVNVGDSITLSFNVRFNDDAGVTNGAGDNFRFALFDLNGQTKVTADNTATAGVDGQTDDWRGYWFGTKSGTGTGSGGSIREKITANASGDNPFAAASPNNTTVESKGTVGGTTVTLVSSTDGDATGPLYSGVMTLTKTAAGIDLSGSFTGNDGANTFAASDTTSPFPVNFGAVAFLNGGGVSADQLIFSNVSVVPEPSALALVGLAGLACVRRRRLA
jgi:hypothetical protein